MRVSDRTRCASLLGLAVAGWLLLGEVALAQGSCPEGRTLSGECVNPSLAAGARQAAVLFSQPLISYTAYPVLPVEDQRQRYPDSLKPPQSGATVGGGVPFGGIGQGGVFPSNVFQPGFH